MIELCSGKVSLPSTATRKFCVPKAGPSGSRTSSECELAVAGIHEVIDNANVKRAGRIGSGTNFRLAAGKLETGTQRHRAARSQKSPCAYSGWEAGSVWSPSKKKPEGALSPVKVKRFYRGGGAGQNVVCDGWQCTCKKLACRVVRTKKGPWRSAGALAERRT